jgi:predicted transcriptional regulator of viral defense system
VWDERRYYPSTYSIATFTAPWIIDVTCADLHWWLLRRRLPVIDVSSPDWQEARQSVGLNPGITQAKCLARMVDQGLLRRVRRGLYVVIDPAREAPAVAIASGAYAHLEHYVSTDAALAVHGLIDQPIPTITVIMPRPAPTPFQLGKVRVKVSRVSDGQFRRADHYRTTLDGFRVDLASRVQAVLDALDDPRRMTHRSLLPEVLRSFDAGELGRLAAAALQTSQASAQRLGYLIEDAGAQVPSALDALHPSSVVSLYPGASWSVFSTRWRVRG